MITITSPKNGEFLDNSKEVLVSWNTDTEYYSYDIIVTTKSGEFAAAKDLSSAVRTFGFSLTGYEGPVTIKVLGYFREKESEVAVSDNKRVILYRYSDKGTLLTIDRECIKNPVFLNNNKIALVDYKNNKIIFYNRDTQTSGIEYLDGKVFQDRISGIELSVQQQYHPSSITETSGLSSFILSEYTDNRFKSFYTDENGIFYTDKIFNCGHIGVSVGKIFTDKLTDKEKVFHLWKEGDKYIVNQEWIHSLSGIGADFWIFHDDIKDAILQIPYPTTGDEFRKSLIVEVLYSDGTPVPDVQIKGLEDFVGATNSEGIWKKEFDLLPNEEQKFLITPSKAAHIFYPVSSEADFSDTDEVYLMFIATRLYSLSGDLLNQKGKHLQQIVEVTVVNSITGETGTFTGVGSYTTGASLREGIYIVSAYRENAPFSPEQQIVEIRDDVSGINFWTNTWSVSGKAYDLDGQGIEEVTVEIGSLSAVTDSEGNYINDVVLPGDYKIKASKEITIVDMSKLSEGDYLNALKKTTIYFTPEEREITVSNEDVPNQDFYQLPTYKIKGKFITHPSTRIPKEEFQYAVLTDNKRMLATGQEQEEKNELGEVRVNGTEYALERKYLLNFGQTSGLEFTVDGLLEGRYVIAPLKTAEFKFIDPKTGSETWIPAKVSPEPWNRGWVFDEKRYDYYVNRDYLNEEYPAYSGSLKGKVYLSSSPLSGLSLEVVGGEYEYEFVEDDSAAGGTWYPRPKVVTTDELGEYFLEYQVPGTYDVYPDLNAGDDYYSYIPDRETGREGTISKENLDISGLDFDATLYPTYIIQGNVKDSESNPLPEIMIEAIDGEMPTRKIGQQPKEKPLICFSGISDEYGNYTAKIHYPASYTVSPSQSIWSFDPVSRIYEVNTDITGADFVGIYKDEDKPIYTHRYKITGKVIDIFGNCVSGIKIDYGNSKDIKETDSKGEYEILGLAVGDYTIYPKLLDVSEEDRIGYTFSPDSKISVKIRNKNVSGIDFTAIPKYSITGKVIDINGNPVKDISVLTNQHHSRVIEISGSEIVWEYDKDLFIPERVAWEHENIVSITNKGKHSVIALNRTGNTIESRFGSDEPANGIPGQRSGLDMLSYPNYARYRKDKRFVITDKDNFRLIIAKEGQKREQFIDELNYSLPPGQIMETNDPEVDLLGYFFNDKGVYTLDRKGNVNIEKSFDDFVSGIDISTKAGAEYDESDVKTTLYTERIVLRNKYNIALKEKDDSKLVQQSEIIEFRGR